MDPEENYDPDCDVSRFLNFPDPPLEELMLSPDAEQVPPLQTPLPCPPFSQAMFSDGASLSLPFVGREINITSDPITSAKPMPLSVEDVIISAMEAFHIEGFLSSTAKPVDEVMYEPVFQQYPPGHRDCTDCIILREVTHSSPNRKLIFTVHGGLGTLDHAVFDVEYFQESGQSYKHEFFYVDLCRRSHDWVKNFVVGCVTLLKSDTTGTTNDSLSSFYDTLCADMNTPVDEILGLDFGQTLCFDYSDDYFMHLHPNFEVGETSTTEDHVLNDNSFRTGLPVEKEPTMVIPNLTALSPSDSTSALDASSTMSSTKFIDVFGASRSENPITVEDTQRTTIVEPVDRVFRHAPTKTHLALQRQRTANMRLFELANYLHLPMAEAARRLKVCSTALKHICRRNGLVRWPSRQIQAIDRQIAKLKRDMVRGNRRGGLFAIKDAIETLQIKKRSIYDKMLNDH